MCSGSVTIENNDITDTDVLRGISGLTFDQVLQSVIDDYNNIPTSYLRLARYPADPNNPGTPAAGDSIFTIEKASKRTIEICFGETNAAAGISGGYAKAKYEGQYIVGCGIQAKAEHTKNARFLTHLVVHELGHCFGLEHPQESTNSVMSYFNNGEVFIRLQNDDYAGLTNRYPNEESYAKEEPTYGLSGCSPK